MCYTELHKLDMWLQANKLTLNIAIAHYIMVFRRARIKCKTDKIIIRKNEIAAIKFKSTTLLGVIFDNKLKWKEHLQYIKKN